MNSPALMQVVQQQTRFLKGFAFNLTKDKTAAEDLVQETLFRAFKNIDRVAHTSNIKGWLSMIMKNTFINNYRKKKRRVQTQDYSEVSGLNFGNGGTTQNEGELNLSAQEIMRIVEELDEKLKRPFMMAYQGYSYEEISQQLALPMGTIKSQIFWARKRLQNKLRELELV